MKKIVVVAINILFLASAYSQPVDRSKKPNPGPPPVITFGNPVVYKLANGLTVLVVENHKLPTVRAGFRIDMGPVTEGSKVGVLTIMGGMLNEGTTSKTKAQFDEAVDILGANVGLSSGGGYASALTKYFNQAFALMAEGLRHPAFPQESFDKLVSQQLTGLKTVERSASSISGRVVNALAYGVNHPSGEFETETSLKSITLNDVKEAYKKYITPSRAYLTFVGDIKPAAAKALADKAFGDWKGSALTLEKIPVVPNPVKTEIDVIDVPSAVQSEITVVNLVNIPMSSPDYFAALIANRILGGGAESHLFMNLREKHGFTYGAYSDIGTGRFQADFAAAASVRNEKVDSSVREFLYEINQMRTTKVTATELQNTKNQFNGAFALGMENIARTADFASNILINNLPPDFYRTYLKKVNAVTADDVMRVANKYFNYTNTRIVVVGKQEQVLPGLQKLGYPVKLYDKYAAPVTAESNNGMAKSDVAPAIVINAFINALGGKEALQKVNTIAATGKMTVQGFALDITSKEMAPNKELVVITTGGQTVMKNEYDGTNGYQMQMGQKKDMEGDELQEKKDQKGLFAQLFYSDPGYKLEMKGIGKQNGADAYIISVTTPSGKTKTEYYDVKSSLLVKADEGESGITENSDYRKVGDVLMPFKIVRTVNSPAGTQEITLTFSTIKFNEGVSAEDFK